MLIYAYNDWLHDMEYKCTSCLWTHPGRRKTQLDRDVRWNSVILLREKKYM